MDWFLYGRGLHHEKVNKFQWLLFKWSAINSDCQSSFKDVIDILKISLKIVWNIELFYNISASDFSLKGLSRSF